MVNMMPPKRLGRWEGGLSMVAVMTVAAVLPLLTPAAAKAQGCFIGELSAFEPQPASPASLQPIPIAVAGIPYNLCTVYGSFDDLAPYLTSAEYAPWYDNGDATGNGADLAKKLADALTQQYYPGGEITDSANRLFYALNDGPTNEGNGTTDFSSAYFLWGDASRPSGRQEWVTAYQESNGNPGFKTVSKFKPAPDQKFWYFYADDPINGVPGPLPLLGAGAAFGWSRRLRRRLKHQSGAVDPSCGSAAEALPVALVVSPLQGGFNTPGRG